jgi:GntR family transcriptional regulator
MPTGLFKTPLQPRSAEPLYKQIARDILQCLANGEWKPGAQLPTESALAERFSVAIFTVRAGIGELVSSGILVRMQGKGTFVTRHIRDRGRQHFSKVFDNDNLKVIPTKEVLTSFTKKRADEQTIKLLCLDWREKPFVYYWETVLEVNEAGAVSIRYVTVPTSLFPGLSARMFRHNKQNLYALYQDFCGVNVIRMEDRVRATRADAHQAKVLNVNRGGPLLQIDRIAFTYNDVPVELRTRIYENSHHHYLIEQTGI